MASVKIYGHSDDMIEIEGDLKAEFEASLDDGTILGFNDGTILEVYYTDRGVWRINRLATGTAKYSKIEAPPEEYEEDNYSDIVTLQGDLRWAIKGNDFTKNTKK